jgi:hypothetical protein
MEAMQELHPRGWGRRCTDANPQQTQLHLPTQRGQGRECVPECAHVRAPWTIAGARTTRDVTFIYGDKRRVAQPVLRMPDAMPLMVMSIPSRSAALVGSLRSLLMMSACMMLTMSVGHMGSQGLGRWWSWRRTIRFRETGKARVSTEDGVARLNQAAQRLVVLC